MYNDYYLQEISNKLTTTNSSLEDVITNQEQIIANQQEIITDLQIINHTSILIASAIILGILIKHIIRLLP